MSAATAGMLKKINETLEKHFMGNVTKIDNGIVKMEIIEFGFDDWFTAANGYRTISHTLGTDVDTVVVLPSKYDWDPYENVYDDYYSWHTLCVKLVRSFNFHHEIYSGTTIEFYNADGGTESGYDIKINNEDVLVWNENSVSIKALGDMVFAPSSVMKYKLLVIKHT